MIIEYLQVLALICEITGFTLACIHVFQEPLIKLLDKRVYMGYQAYFSYFDFMEGADADKRLTMKERDVISRNNTMIFVISIVFWIPFFIYVVDFGAHPGWWPLEFFAAGCLSLIFSACLRLLAVLVITFVYSLLQSAGRGNFVVGIGFLLACLGLSFETYQVWHSSLRWASLAIWGFVSIALLLLLRRYLRSKSEQS